MFHKSKNKIKKCNFRGAYNKNQMVPWIFQGYKATTELYCFWPSKIQNVIY